MIYAKVDVMLRDHVRAQKAGAAMSTWLWGLLYVRGQETDGEIPLEALERSWCSKEAVAHAKKLVAVGLWDVIADGYRICRYSAKNETKEVIDERREKARQRMSSFRAPKERSQNVRANERRTEALHAPGCNALVPDSDSDSDSVSGSLPGRDPDPDRSPTPRVWGRGPTAERALEVFADAITAVTGEPHHIGPAPFLRDDVCSLMNKRAPRESLDAALTWLGDSTQAWVRATPTAEERKPSRLADWLNAGKPDRRSKVRAGAIVQSSDNRAWKLPEGLE